jgi:hypothetical protein
MFMSSQIHPRGQNPVSIGLYDQNSLLFQSPSILAVFKFSWTLVLVTETKMAQRILVRPTWVAVPCKTESQMREKYINQSYGNML